MSLNLCASLCAPVPRPGKSLGQVATIEASTLSLATAGADKDVAATAATPVAAAVLKNLRLEGALPFNDFFSLIIFSPLF
jgi:hypothetical protein